MGPPSLMRPAWISGRNALAGLVGAPIPGRHEGPTAHLARHDVALA